MVYSEFLSYYEDQRAKGAEERSIAKSLGMTTLHFRKVLHRAVCEKFGKEPKV